MSGEHPADAFRPAGMAPVETVLWEATSRAAWAAHQRLLSDGADAMTPAALEWMAYLDAVQAAQPHVERVATTHEVRETLKIAFGWQGVRAAREIIALTPAAVQQ